MFLQTMNVKDIDKSLTALIEKRNELSTLTYDNKDYDRLEEELHDMEDDFIEKYGEYLETALEKIHDKLCPDNDVLLPIAYLAHKYNKGGKNPDGTTIYDVDYSEGVWVDVDKMPGKDTRLVLVPNPVRILLLIDGKKKEVVWKAE
jgi:hypothetical protein